MNTERFKNYFKTPDLAQCLLDRLCEQLENITIGGAIKIDEVKPHNLGGSTAFSTKKKRARNKFQAYWLKISAMGKITFK